MGGLTGTKQKEAFFRVPLMLWMVVVQTGPTTNNSIQRMTLSELSRTMLGLIIARRQISSSINGPIVIWRSSYRLLQLYFNGTPVAAMFF